MNGSWDIAHDQAPSLVACGATQAEAQDRVNNERALYAAHSSTNWWAWRYYDAARSAVREPNRQLPGNP